MRSNVQRQPASTCPSLLWWLNNSSTLSVAFLSGLTIEVRNNLENSSQAEFLQPGLSPKPTSSLQAHELHRNRFGKWIGREAHYGCDFTQRQEIGGNAAT